MDSICLPVRYDELTENDVQAHLRYCASSEFQGNLVEFLLREPGIVIPIVKRTYKTQAPNLDVLIRSGSFGRVQLGQLKERLYSEGYDLKVSYTSKRRLLRRIVVRLVIDDGTVALSGLNLLRCIACTIGVSWPSAVAVGYALGTETINLPGTLAYRSPLINAEYQIGLAVGKLLKRIIS